MNKPKSNPLEILLASLYSRINYERQLKVTPRSFKLQNMREFLRRLGDPHLRFPVIHVAGTKGKGSVSMMLGQIMTAAGRKTGVYVSPHLESINQRILIDSDMISDELLVQTLSAIEPVANEMDQEADDADRRELTFFEVITAAAFHCFASQKVDTVVLEVGLGGRLDSTNVCQPDVSVITNISFDHTRQLGNTLDKIAGEKAGIIKPGIPVVSGVLDQEAAAVIQRVAAENNAPLWVLNRDFRLVPSSDPSRFSVVGNIDGFDFSISDVALGMAGPHQQTNAAIAVAVTQVLNRSRQNPNQKNRSETWSRSIVPPQIKQGLAETKLAGRTEIVSTQPTVMLDIAHNVASVGALVTTLLESKAFQNSRQKTLIMAVSREKDVAGMLPPLVGHFDQVIFTKYQNNPRGRDARELLDLALDCEGNDSQIQQLGNPKFQVQELPLAAWKSVLETLADHDFVCMAGSAFLVAELRPVVLEWNSKRTVSS